LDGLKRDDEEDVLDVDFVGDIPLSVRDDDDLFGDVILDGVEVFLWVGVVVARSEMFGVGYLVICSISWMVSNGVGDG
jgi:hypothetical protein